MKNNKSNVIHEAHIPTIAQIVFVILVVIVNQNMIKISTIQMSMINHQTLKISFNIDNGNLNEEKKNLQFMNHLDKDINFIKNKINFSTFYNYKKKINDESF